MLCQPAPLEYPFTDNPSDITLEIDALEYQFASTWNPILGGGIPNRIICLVWKYDLVVSPRSGRPDVLKAKEVFGARPLRN